MGVKGPICAVYHHSEEGTYKTQSSVSRACLSMTMGQKTQRVELNLIGRTKSKMSLTG